MRGCRCSRWHRGGRLGHLQGLAETTVTGLANISAVEMLRVGAEVQVLVASTFGRTERWATGVSAVKAISWHQRRKY